MAKILMVEDDATVLAVAKYTLNKLGCETIQVENGTDALEKAKQDNFDIYLVDVGLPDISGIEVIRTIHESKNNAVIIAVTGYTDDETKNACLAAGAKEVLHKPVLLNGYKALLTRHNVI